MLHLQVFSSPFSIEVEKLNPLVATEMIDLQCCSRFEDLNRRLHIVQFWEEVAKDGRFVRTIEIVAGVLAMFGSTFDCEQLFSLMKGIKTKNRSRLTDHRLNNLLRIASNKSIKVDLKAIVEKKPCQKSKQS